MTPELTNSFVRGKQRGVGLIGFLIVGCLLAFALLLGFRTVPAVNEYLAVQRIVRALGQEASDGASMMQVRRSFDRRALVDGVRSVRGSDLNIYRQADGVVVEVRYERAVPVVGNLSLLFDFHASTVD